MSDKDEHAEKAETSRQGTSALEWAVAAIGGLLFLLMVSYMVIDGLDTSERQPEIQIVASNAFRQGDGFAVRFDATNIGDQTASSLIVRATLYQGDRELETADVTIDYLPGRSMASGGFWFLHDPAQFKLEIRAVSYLDP